MYEGCLLRGILRSSVVASKSMNGTRDGSRFAYIWYLRVGGREGGVLTRTAKIEAGTMRRVGLQSWKRYSDLVQLKWNSREARQVGMNRRMGCHLARGHR